MRSPFPGMDPYLEAHWGDVHARLIVYASNQLNAQLPDDLQARVEESLAVLQADEPARTLYPDVSVVEESGVLTEHATAETAVATRDVARPYVVPLDEPTTLRHLEIVAPRDGNRLVTAIEVLSPANKVGSTGQLIYIRWTDATTAWITARSRCQPWARRTPAGPTRCCNKRGVVERARGSPMLRDILVS